MLFATLACSRTSVRLVTLGIIFLILLAFCLALPASAQTRVVRSDVHHDVSPPLRDLAKIAPTQEGEREEAEELPLIPLPSGFKPASEPDSVHQQTAVPADVTLAPTIGLNFDGIGKGVP